MKFIDWLVSLLTVDTAPERPRLAGDPPRRPRPRSLRPG